MDSTIRIIAKAVTWQISGLFMMTVIGFLFTGSIVAGGGIAFAGAASGFACYFVHEKLWSKVSWGRDNHHV